MSSEDFRKEMRMFARSPLALAIFYTIIERADLTIMELNEEFINTEILPQIRSKKNGGITINVSRGGLCMVTECELEESEVIRIDMPLTETFLSAPTLAQVKWINNLGNNFQVGLSYLF